MNLRKRTFQRTAGGTVRSLVIGLTTLAMLLVCFSIYRDIQTGDETVGEARLPGVPTGPAESPAAAFPPAPSADEGGDALLGPGSKIRLTLYPREGDQARLEVEVEDWWPTPGASNEYELKEPTFRLLTPSGNAVRVSAGSGTMQADREGSSLDPQRGSLMGGVLIEIDRLTVEDRAKLPPQRRDQSLPEEIIRIESEEIEFDLEFARVVIPGAMKLTASDVLFSASDLEVRFNETANRVETLRVSGGGAIDLLGGPRGLGLGGAGEESDDGETLTVVEWLRATIEAKLAARVAEASDAARDAVATERSADGVTIDDDGVPVFRASTKSAEEDEKEAIRYFARFEDDVRVRQNSGEDVLTELESTILEILRDFTDRDRKQFASRDSSGGAESQGSSAVGTEQRSKQSAEVTASETLTVRWSGRLVVEALSEGDERWTEDGATELVATGSPARLSYPDGDVVASRMRIKPDTTELWFFGEADQPVVVRSGADGTLEGRALYTRQTADAFELDVTGPGHLADAPQVASAGAEGAASGEEVESAAPLVSFGDRLKATGRISQRMSVTFRGRVRRESERILTQAHLLGRSRLQRDDTFVEGDDLLIRFSPDRASGSVGQTVERLEARGDVLMAQGIDEIRSEALDVDLAAARDGSIWPTTAQARGDVRVSQDGRALKARDSLDVRFERVEQVASSDGAAASRGAGVPAGHEEPSYRVVVRDLQAEGDVEVQDPVEPLDVRAHRLVCRLDRAGDIQTAVVESESGGVAAVRLDTFSVQGERINLNVPDQWAEVPGAGRLTFQSEKDLDGREAKEPIPVSVTWTDWMKYHGRENRAAFAGSVHATSKTDTTFDADHLQIEFADVPPEQQAAGEPAPGSPWWAVDRFQELLAKARGERVKRKRSPEFSKEPASILAIGSVKAVTSEFDETTGAPTSRVLLKGPRLSVNLRSEISKLLIEGAGDLQIEDLRPANPAQAQKGTSPKQADLFDMTEDESPSTTLITWKDRMWYDFSIDQTLFEGDVHLTHFSGEALKRFVGIDPGGLQDGSAGRSTFLRCGELRVDFLDSAQRRTANRSRRMGRLSTASLRQFQASRNVRLDDRSEGLLVAADRIVYERAREILAIYGLPRAKARIRKIDPGKLPTDLEVQRVFYNLATGEFELADAAGSGR